MSGIVAFTSVCQEDIGLVPQYLAEARRLRLPFAVHLDRVWCPEASALITDPLCVGFSEQPKRDVEFVEYHKQRAMNIACRTAGVGWAMAWDIDEVFETAFSDKVRSLEGTDALHVQCRWLNCWGDMDHVRVDGPFHNAPRVKFYRVLPGISWKFTHTVINGPKMFRHGSQGTRTEEAATLGRIDLVCLHMGLMTKELRLQHKERWDRIYTRAVGANPYGIWNMALDEDNYPPVVEPHEYLK